VWHRYGEEETRKDDAETHRGEARPALQMQNDYRLETDTLGGHPVLRRLKDSELVRPPSANASSVKALKEHGLVDAARSRDALTIVWRFEREVRPGDDGFRRSVTKPP
jgi:hypothetical protein